MHKLKLPLISIAMLVGACASPSGTPFPTSFPQTYQLHVDAVSNWQLIAQDLALNLQRNLEESQNLNRPIFVVFSTKESTFERGFKTLLIDELIKQGMNIAKVPEDNLKLNIDSQFIKSNSIKEQVIFDYSKNISTLRPSHEMIVSLTISDDQNIYFSQSDVYYIFDHDKSLYAKPAQPSQVTFEIKGR